jgi:hypothetical protein
VETMADCFQQTRPKTADHQGLTRSRRRTEQWQITGYAWSAVEAVQAVRQAARK